MVESLRGLAYGPPTSATRGGSLPRCASGDAPCITGSDSTHVCPCRTPTPSAGSPGDAPCITRSSHSNVRHAYAFVRSPGTQNTPWRHLLVGVERGRRVAKGRWIGWISSLISGRGVPREMQRTLTDGPVRVRQPRLRRP
jgi:hypothetical protein